MTAVFIFLPPVAAAKLSFVILTKEPGLAATFWLFVWFLSIRAPVVDETYPSEVIPFSPLATGSVYATFTLLVLKSLGSLGPLSTSLIPFFTINLSAGVALLGALVPALSSKV